MMAARRAKAVKAKVRVMVMAGLRVWIRVKVGENVRAMVRVG